MTDPQAFPIHGTVYGVLLNSQAEWRQAEAHMHDAPYKAPPQAPVLYIKTANTWTPHGHTIALPRGVDAVEVGATLAVVMGAQGHVRGHLLLNDLSLPHDVQGQGFYRPPVKSKCIDGFLGLGPQLWPAADLPAPNAHVLEVRVNGVLQQTVDLRRMRRAQETLLADVGAFMTLHAGDVLMLGLDVCDEGARAGRRPLARAGDVIEVQCPGVPGLGVMRHTLAQEAA